MDLVHNIDCICSACTTPRHTVLVVDTPLRHGHPDHQCASPRSDVPHVTCAGCGIDRLLSWAPDTELYWCARCSGVEPHLVAAMLLLVDIAVHDARLEGMPAEQIWCRCGDRSGSDEHHHQNHNLACNRHCLAGCRG